MKQGSLLQTPHPFILYSAVLAITFLHADTLRGPDTFESPPLPSSARPSTSALRELYAGQALYFYQNILSRVMESPCKMHPSCSVYSQHAIREHGVGLGILLTADRLLHEGGEQQHAPRIRVNGQLRFHDPVENNTFWWQP